MFEPRFGPDDLEIASRERGYDGYFQLDVYRFRHRLFGGGWSGEVQREVFERGHAVAVLPYDPIGDRVLLVRQVRLPALLAGAPPWQIEPVAGIIEGEEPVEEVARREALEEAGVAVTALWRLFRFMTSAGASTESVELFVGRADLSAAGGLHGLDEEHEDIEAVAGPFEEAYALIEAGQLQNTPAIMALQWLKLNRERLRAAWRS
jgi:ADP-ribose pyrophosphatase